MPPVDRRAATIFAPSAEQATDCQFALGRLLFVQFPPKFVEIQTPSLLRPAINRLPSADEAVLSHVPLGAVVGVHVAPESVER